MKPVAPNTVAERPAHRYRQLMALAIASRTRHRGAASRANWVRLRLHSPRLRVFMTTDGVGERCCHEFRPSEGAGANSFILKNISQNTQ